MATRVIVYDSRISGLFNPGENAVEFVREQLIDIEAQAQRRAPDGSATSKTWISGRIRQGEVPLKRSIRNAGVLRRGRYGAGGSVYAAARHALFVHEGTRPAITAGGRLMPIPVKAGSPQRNYRRYDPEARTMTTSMRPGRTLVQSQVVSGQRANPFLREAGDAVVATYLAMPVWVGATGFAAGQRAV